MNILFIGNDQEVLSLTQNASINPHFAHNMQEALEILSGINVDGIVIDISSNADPGDNLECLEIIQEKADLPIIVLGEDDSEVSGKALKLGAQDYLIKTDLNKDVFNRILHYAVRLAKASKTINSLSREIDKLKSYEKPFKAFFEHSPIGMVLLDFEGKIIRTNQTIQKMLGYEDEELRNQYLSLFTYPENSLNYIENFQALIDGKKDYFEMENRFFRKNGQTAWWRLNISLVRDLRGNPQFVFGIIKDITRWKKSEVDLKKAKEVAEETTRVKSDFLANMSHEIRTPIHTITGMTELLLDTKLDMEQQEYAEQVRFSVDVLLSLINDILDFSKIEAGKLSLEVIDFDLYKMVEDAVDLVTLEAHKKGLEVIVYIDTEAPHMLRGDPVRLGQIIINLFSNAVKFTRQGEIVISVEKISSEETLSTIKFNVKDTGIGITEQKLGRLFKSFSQADSSMTRRYGGTGLGLSISKNLAELMDGQIGVESEVGKGSSFWFTAILEKQEKENIYQDVPEDFFEDLRVLLVDDNATSRKIMKEYLTDWGCLVDEVENGPEALEVLRSSSNKSAPYPLAFVDLRMPGMDGWQLASEINADKSINSTKLILLTPAGLSGDEAKMKLLKWFDGYLGKPVKRGELLAGVFAVINSDLDLEQIDIEVLQEVEEELVPELTQSREKFKILVAEDHEVNQQLFKTILEKIGYRIDLVDDGVEALDAAEQREYDLIFMDIQMPNMNGYEATKRIRALGKKTPIVAVTANALPDEINRCFTAGMDDYLAKPFKKKDLLPLLRKWLSSEALNGEMIEPDQEEDSGAVFDFKKAVETFLGKEEVVLSVLSSFVQKVEDQLKIIHDALNEYDFKKGREEAHAIKGGSWNLEAKQLGDAAKELEDVCREADSACPKADSARCAEYHALRENQRQEAENAFAVLKKRFKAFKKAVSPLIH